MLRPRSSFSANRARVHPAAFVVWRLTDQYSVAPSAVETVNSREGVEKLPAAS